MRLLRASCVVALVACTPPAGSQIGPGERSPRDSAGSRDSDTDPTEGDTDTDTPDTGTAIDCSVLPPRPESHISTQFQTEEDFDFDPRGFLMAQNGSQLVGVRSDGSVQVFAANLVGDIAGIRVMSTGEVAVAQPSIGGISVVAANGGGYYSVFTDIQHPNSLAVDTSARVYIVETFPGGRVFMADPATQERWLVGQSAGTSNGVTLSPDEQTIYVVEAYNTGTRIVAVDRLTDTTFAPPRVFAELPAGESYTTLAADICGNLYTVTYSTGRVIRVSADGTFVGTLVDIGIGGNFSGIRFGNGVDVFGRNTLFVTRRAVVYGIDAGIPGRVPVYPVP